MCSVASVARTARPIAPPTWTVVLTRPEASPASLGVAPDIASDAGLASGLVNTTVQVGGAIGLAVLATLATEHTDGLLADGESTASALNSGYHIAYLIGAALVAVAIVTALAVLRPAPAGRADEAGTELKPAYSEAA